MNIPRKPLRRLLSVLLIAGCATTLAAQNIPDALRTGMEAKKAAYAAFKADDVATALGHIDRAVAANPSDSPAQLRVAENLAQIAAQLQNNSDGRRAALAAQLAIQRITDQQQSFGKAYQGRAARLAAQVYDMLLGDRINALANYKQALAADAGDKGAAEGVARMEAALAMLATKAAENEVLRSRANAAAAKP